MVDEVPGRQDRAEVQRALPLAPLTFEMFQGINTSTSRFGVPDEQMWWCDGWMPIGPRLLRTMPGVGDALWTCPDGTTVVFFTFANLDNVAVALVVVSDGSIWQIATQIGTVTEVAPAGTLLNPSINTVGFTQWADQYIAIVADQPNGYWVWDGVFLYGASQIAPLVTLTYNGNGYLSSPVVTPYGGSGAGATFSATVANGIVTAVSLTNPGSGYQVYDAVGLAFSGGGITARTAILTPSVSGGTISTVAITNAGSGYTNGTSVAAVQIYGGGGTGASITLNISSGTVANVTIANAGSGYVTAPTLFVVDPNNPVARSGPLDMMPFGISGTAAETYAGRVWIINGPLVIFSAPGSVFDFATSSGGGNFTSVDSFLRVGFKNLKQTNGFLYLVADSSINAISNVQTSGTPATTTFSNQNVDPEVGTPWPATVSTFGRNILFANSFGAHVVYGGAATKVSEDLDGIYNTVPNFNGFNPSIAKATVFGKKLWFLLIPIVDPISGSEIRRLMVWDGRKWWATGQDIDLTFVQSQEIDSVLTAWGTDGTSLYPMFQQPASYTKVVQSKFWEAPGGYQYTKAISRLWALFNFREPYTLTWDISIDSNIGDSADYTFVSPEQEIPVINASDVTIPTINASSVTISVYSIFAGSYVIPPQAVGQQGELVGLTVTTQEPDLSFLSAKIQPEIAQYRG